MTQKAILFIPDISGFTEFVHHTDIKHSGHIISELLEVLLDSNSLNFKLAEIEGDALFLYKLSETIDYKDVENQAQEMYKAFHKHLKRYEYERICRCGACSSAYNLSIKFIVHFGEIDFIEVKDSKKPYGSNVIQAHRLLKNNVPYSEYVLFSENAKPISNSDEKVIVEQYDFGEIKYTYQPLESLKKQIPYVPPIPDDVPKHFLYEIIENIKAPMPEVYEIISNFDYRLLWLKGIDKLEYDKNKVNKSGRKHKCIINKNLTVDQKTITKEVEENQLVYGESTNDMPMMNTFNVYFILGEDNNKDTILNIQVYADFKPLGRLLKPVITRKLLKNTKENMNDLVALIESDFVTTVRNTNEYY